VDSKGIVPALYKLLARLEDRIYSRIPPPNIVLKLRIPLEKAKIRNRERIKADKEDDSYLEFRHQQCAEWRMADAKYVFDVDTDRPLSETVLSVKKLIWSVL
jgi:thymidylate kinase